jgi:hypothetical protein
VVVAMGVGWFLDHAAGTWYRRVADAKLQLATEKLNDLGWAVKTYPNGREFSVEPIYRPEWPMTTPCIVTKVHVSVNARQQEFQSFGPGLGRSPLRSFEGRPQRSGITRAAWAERIGEADRGLPLREQILPAMH